MTTQTSINAESNTLRYTGKTGALYKLWLVNFLLNVITLNIHSFWAMVKLRKFMTAGFILNNDRFEHTGTAKELIIGFFKGLLLVAVILGPLLGLEIFLATQLKHDEGHLSYSSLYMGVLTLRTIIMVVLIIVAQYASLRYKIARTQWRGIRARLQGNLLGFAALSLVRTFLNCATLGLLIPRSDSKITAYIVEHLSFGNVQPSFTESPGELTKINIITLLLILPTLGISRCWYIAAFMRYRFKHLALGGLQFSSDVKGGDIFSLYFINVLLFLVTLSLGIPLILQRNARFTAQHVTILGNIDAVEFAQIARDNRNLGEGLANFLETDFALI